MTLATADEIVATGRSARTVGLVGTGFVTRITARGSGLPDVLVMRHGTELRIGLRTPRDAATDDSGSGTRESGQLALLRPLTPDNGVVALVRRQPGSDNTVVLILQLGATASAGELAEVRTALAAATTEPAPEPANPGTRAIDLAREAIGARPRRHALLALAAKHELSRCLDLLLCVEEREVIAIAEQLPPEPATAWDIERAFYAAVLPALQRGELTAAVDVCLRRHLGALALDPTALEFALQASPTMAQFDQTLLDDNLRALDARHARRRVVAAAWLRATHQPVADYDPLAPRQQRKAAIQRHRQTRR